MSISIKSRTKFFVRMFQQWRVTVISGGREEDVVANERHAVLDMAGEDVSGLGSTYRE